MTNYQIDKFGFQTKEVSGDAGYDEPEIHAEMLERNIKTYIPRKDRGGNPNYETFTKEMFEYVPERDVYICPNGCLLQFSSFKKGKGKKRYSSKTRDCNICPLREQCLPGKSKTKQLDRPYHWTEYEKQHENDGTDRYLGVQRLRKIWCEGTFSHQKARHCIMRAKLYDEGKNEGHCSDFGAVPLVRLRGEPKKVNLKRMIKWIKNKASNTQKSCLHVSFSAFARVRAFFMGFC